MVFLPGKTNRMARKTMFIAIESLVLTTFLFFPIVFSVDNDPIPARRYQVNAWFTKNVQPLAARKGTLDLELEAAESKVRVIRVKKEGSGHFKTITEAVRSIPAQNTVRTIVYIGGGNYTEKVLIQPSQRFVTFYGHPNDMPVMVYGGTTRQYGTVDTATLMALGDYFSAVNIIFVNSAPRGAGQATAMRISGNKSSFYGCKFYGFQDTLLDDRGFHFFKDCYITGTVDFIYGNGRSLYVSTELHVIPGDTDAYIVAHARDGPNVNTGYSFAQCTVTGKGDYAYLGRAWMPYSKVVFSLCDLSSVIRPQGWSDKGNPAYDQTLFFGEFNNRGPGADPGRRARFTKKLDFLSAIPYITLGYIQASKWLLPPATLDMHCRSKRGEYCCHGVG